MIISQSFLDTLSAQAKANPRQRQAYDYDEACRNEERFMELAEMRDKKEILRFMEEVVPEYRSTNERYV